MMKKKKFKFFDFILYFFFITLTFMLSVILISYLRGEKPNFFGLRIYVIQTNSMEPNYPKGTLVLENSKFRVENIKNKDIITFNFSYYDGIPNTHRVIGYYYQNKKTGEKNSIYDVNSFEEFYQKYNIDTYEIIGFKTKGDNPEAKEDIDPVLFNQLEAKFICKLSLAAFIYKLIVNPIGFLFIIIVPMLTIIVVQIISSIKKYKKKEEQEEVNIDPKQLEEEIKRKAIEEYIKNHKE